MRAALVLLVFVSMFPESAQAQQQLTRVIVSVAEAPVFLKPDRTLEPLRVAKGGSSMIVLEQTSEWIQIEFQDPQYGRRVGYIERKFVTFPALDLSVPTPAAPPQATSPAPAGTSKAQTNAPQPSRGGFTLLVNLGAGIQSDSGLEETAIGLAGANLGIGGFVTPNLAILGRFSGTSVFYDTPFVDAQVSGVVAPTLQYWPSDKVNLEGGVGLGFWDADGVTDQGVGLILGVGFTVFNRGKHNLQVGFEYAPAFTEPGTVHNFGITFGYQLF